MSYVLPTVTLPDDFPGADVLRAHLSDYADPHKTLDLSVKVYIGSSSPTVTNVYKKGDIYFKSVTNNLYVFNGTAWGEVTGGEMNVITSISVNGTQITPVNKNVNISLSAYALQSALEAEVSRATAAENGKASTVHVHAIADVTGLQNALNAKVNTSDVKDNVVSSDTDKPLSANMGRELNSRIDSLTARGRYLSLWNASTGLPSTNPTTSPYTYKTGDYYVVGTITSATGTNYKPSGSSYTTGVPSTTVETGTIKLGDTYCYDGTSWSLLSDEVTVSFAALSGSPDDNRNLKDRLDSKVEYTDIASVSEAGVVKAASSYVSTSATIPVAVDSDGQMWAYNKAEHVGDASAVLNVSYDGTKNVVKWEQGGATAVDTDVIYYSYGDSENRFVGTADRFGDSGAVLRTSYSSAGELNNCAGVSWCGGPFAGNTIFYTSNCQNVFLGTAEYAHCAACATCAADAYYASSACTACDACNACTACATCYACAACDACNACTACAACNACAADTASTACTAVSACYAMSACYASYTACAAYTTCAEYTTYATYVEYASYASDASTATCAVTASLAMYANEASHACTFGAPSAIVRTEFSTMGGEPFYSAYMRWSDGPQAGRPILYFNGPASTNHFVGEACAAFCACMACTACTACDACNASYACDACTACDACYAASACNASNACYAYNAEYASSATYTTYAIYVEYASHASDASTASYAASAYCASYASVACDACYAAAAYCACFASEACNASYATCANYTSYASYASYASEAPYASDACHAYSVGTYCAQICTSYSVDWDTCNYGAIATWADGPAMGSTIFFASGNTQRGGGFNVFNGSACYAESASAAFCLGTYCAAVVSMSYSEDYMNPSNYCAAMVWASGAAMGCTILHYCGGVYSNFFNGIANGAYSACYINSMGTMLYPVWCDAVNAYVLSTGV